VYSVLKMPGVLEKEGLVALPAKDEGQVRGARRAPARTEAGEPGGRIECALPELSGVALEIACEATDVALFSEPVDRYHGLGHRQPVGCHLRYFIVDGQGRRLAGAMEGAPAAGRDLRGRGNAFGNRLPGRGLGADRAERRAA